MKIHTVKVGGKPTVGDVVYLHWCDARGGRSSGGHEVVAGDTLETIAAGLAISVDRNFMGQFFKIKHVNNRIMIVADGHPPGDIIPEVLGKKTETLTITDQLDG